MSSQIGDMEELTEAAEMLDRWGYTVRRMSDLVEQANAWTAIRRRLYEEQEARRDAERNTPEARERRAQREAQYAAERAAELERLRPQASLA